MFIMLNLDTLDSEIFCKGFIFAKLFRENKILAMAKSFCRLLIKVNHAFVAIFNSRNISFNAI